MFKMHLTLLCFEYFAPEGNFARATSRTEVRKTALCLTKLAIYMHGANLRSLHQTPTAQTVSRPTSPYAKGTHATI